MAEFENFTPTKFVPYSYAKTQGAFVKSAVDGMAELYVREGAGLEALTEILRVWQGKFTPRLVAAAEYDKLLADTYAQEGASSAFAEDIESNLDLSRLIKELPEVEDLLGAEGDAPIIRMINAIFTQALREGASDIHIEPYEAKSVVRFRIDGTLRNIVEPHRALHTALISRIKVMAQMDIAEKRLPQDGRITLKVAGKIVDIRVSTLPTGHGERAVLRILEKDAKRLNLSHLGMGEKTLPQVDALIHQPHGIFLVTGPTGSGKTTTLAAMIDHIDRTRECHIVTIEDPIEVLHRDEVSAVSQREVGFDTESFIVALRSALREDPDVILVGEMRDQETVETALSAAETGHLVFSTLHTIDCVESINRMVDFFPPNQQRQARLSIAGSLKGTICQRLVPTTDGAGRVPALEIMVANGRVQQSIIDPARGADIPSIIREGEYYGMQTFDQALVNLLEEGVIDLRAATQAASNPPDLRVTLQQRGLVSSAVY
jgi:general secretion pathway protein E